MNSITTVSYTHLDVYKRQPDNLDNLNYLAGKTVDYVNKKACEGTIDAHVNTGNVPNIQITLDELTPYSFGYMVYFFEKACALSVYLLGVNPFNRPGVCLLYTSRCV